MKIILIGSSGAGKSTFAKKLSKELDLPLLHLDTLWHKTDYSQAAAVWFQNEQLAFMAKHDQWIIDGNYSDTLNNRLSEADIVLWLQIPTIVAIYRVIKRTLKDKISGKTRSDMAVEFAEKFDLEYLDFLWFVLNFKRNNYPKINKLITENENNCRVYILKNQAEQRNCLQELITTIQDKQ